MSCPTLALDNSNFTIEFWCNLQNVSSGVFVNTWYHVAFCRSGNNFMLFVNGSSVATAINAVSFVSNTFRIGASSGHSSINYVVTGYIDSLRVTLGVARYTANFNPKTDAYLQL